MSCTISHGRDEADNEIAERLKCTGCLTYFGNGLKNVIIVI